MSHAKLNSAIDTGQPHRRVAFAIDAEKNVWMRLAKTGESRAQPEFDQIRRCSDMQFLPALKVKLAGCGTKLGERALQVGQRCPQFESGANASAATYDKFDAEEVLERFDPLPRGGSGQTEQFPSALEGSRPNRELERLKCLQMRSGGHLKMLNATFS